MDKEDPNFNRATNEAADPVLEKDRIERELPNDSTSVMDKEFPKKVEP
jgi:hypothetical protein